MDVKRKVLLIEDDEMIVTMYATRLSAEGFIVTKAADGLEGITKAKAEVPDIILLDVIMPRMDGFEVLEQLKSDEALRNVPVMLLTNLGQDEDRKRGEELGAAAYLVKASYTPSQVAEKVKKLLGLPPG